MADSEKVEIISAAPGRSLWEEACFRISEAWTGRLWDPPIWIVPDGRHKAAAEMALLYYSTKEAIPTKNIYTLLTLAGEILGLPALEAFAKPPWAILTLQEVLGGFQPEAYRASADTPGFAEMLWNGLEDVESRGYFPEETLPFADGSPPPPPFQDLHRYLHAALSSRMRFTAAEILRLARRKLLLEGSKIVLPTPLFIGPLYDPGVIEKEFLRALVETQKLSFIFADEASKWVTEISGLPVPNNSTPETRPSVSLQRPLTPEDELDVTFGSIARWVAEGKYRYRDIRIVHPLARDVLPVVKSAARRYRVPIKGKIALKLAEFPGTILLQKLMDLFDGAWARAEVLEVLRSRLLDAPADEISVLIKAILEGGGERGSKTGISCIELAKSSLASKVARQLERLQALDDSGKGARSGRDFSQWVRECINVIKNIEKDFGNSWEGEFALTETAGGWNALEALLDDYGAHFDRPMNRAAHIKNLKSALRACRYEPVDRRLDVVELCPANREDHLPVDMVIHLGLNSGVPTPEKPNPFTNSVSSRTYSEHFRLFRKLIGNARDQVLLSCPLYDDEGNELALSSFVRSLKNQTPDNIPITTPQMWEPHLALNQGKAVPTELVADDRKGIRIRRGKSLGLIGDRNARWSPTQLEDAIQCAYLHFAKRHLGLQPLADRVSGGVPPQILGGIAHRALENWLMQLKQNYALDIEKWARDEFQTQTSHLDPHLEIDREEEELIRCLSAFIGCGGEKLADDFDPAEMELRFGGKNGQPALDLDLSIGKIQLEGRIDRVDLAVDGRAIVIDYKYKKAENQNKQEFFDEITTGQQPQLPLYDLLATERLKLNPVAWLLIYLRSTVGWGLKLHDGPDLLPNLKTEKTVFGISAEDRARIISAAVATLEEKAASVRDGYIHPKPKDYDHCGPGKCEFADLCRYWRSWK